MKNSLLNLFLKIRLSTMREEGQDLVEYALITGLLAVAAVAMLNNVATAITGIFTTISTTLTSA
jgi:pilus assembly protein Flp/PilA